MSNVAVMTRAPVIVTLHAPVPAHPSPLHPTKVEPAAGNAVSVTSVPCASVAVHVAPQSMVPSGAVLLTIPLPEPALAIAIEWVLIVMTAVLESTEPMDSTRAPSNSWERQSGASRTYLPSACHRIVVSGQTPRTADSSRAQFHERPPSDPRCPGTTG